MPFPSPSPSESLQAPPPRRTDDDGNDNSWWTWSINDDLVFITWVIFALVVIASIAAYFMQPHRKKKSPLDATVEETLGLVKAPVDESSEADKKSKKRGITFDETSTRAESEKSDASSELDPEAGLGVREIGPEFSSSTPDRNLLQTLRSVLSHGMGMVIFGEEGPKKIKLFLVGDELRWKNVKLLARKTHKLDLKQVTNIEWGKKTPAFHAVPARQISEDLCFSLISPNRNIDLKCSSKVERDAMAQGFFILLEEIRRVTP